MRCCLSRVLSTFALGLSMVLGCSEDSNVSQQRASSSPSRATSDSSQQAATTSAEATEGSPAEKAPEKPKRASIYDETANAQELIAGAVRRAKRDHKRVLIEWGGNWCGWCHLLHDTFTKVPGVKEIVYEEYELVLIDSNGNPELLAEYGGQDRQFSYPHLTILDSEGKVLTNQNTEPLEEGKGHSAKAVSEFLTKWMLPRLDAQKEVANALTRAKADGKQILLRVGDPYCGRCKVLAGFLQDHEELLARDYINLKIDTQRMIHGNEAAASHQPANCQGVPWFVILDGSGTVLATSVGRNGNIGYPHQPDEVAHFVKMIRDTRKSITDTELASIEQDLHDFRTNRARRLAEQKSQ